MEEIMLNNRYKLIEKIGDGGMSIVYKGLDTMLNRYVAVKILKEELLQNKGFVEKFEKEARAVARLQHPNIVNIHDVGCDNDRHYIIMELVIAKTLKEYISSHKVFLKNEIIVNIALQIAQALQNAHDNGIVHRDVKPQNILITDDLKIKVTDFGIARVADNKTIVNTNETMGTVHYASPEQLRGGFIDKRSDIYSFGIVMYELATGRLPFDAESSITVAIKHLNDKFIPPSTVNMSLNPAIEKLITIATNRNPDDRFTSMQDIIVVLDRLSLNPNKAFDFEVLKPVPQKPKQKSELLEEDDGLSLERVDKAPINSDNLSDNLSLVQETKTFNVDEINKQDAIVAKKETIEEDLEDEEEEDYDNTSHDDTEDDEDFKDLLFRAFKYAGIAIIGIIIAVVILFAMYVKPLKEAQKEKPFVLQSFVGMNLSEASNKAVENGLFVKKYDTIESDTIEANHIISQSPEAGTTVKSGQTINVIVSSGKKQLKMPNLKQKMLKEAELMVSNNSLKLGDIKEENNNLPKGMVISQSPEPGSDVNAGDRVNLVISMGPIAKKVIMPELLTKTKEEAVKLLTDTNLQVGTVSTAHNSNTAENLVCIQSVKAGVEVDEGSSIDFTISLGKNPNGDTDTETKPDAQTKPEETDPHVKTFYVPLGNDKDSYSIKVTKAEGGNEQVLYEKTHAKAEKMVSINIKGKGVMVLKFYVDGKLINEIPETFPE